MNLANNLFTFHGFTFIFGFIIICFLSYLILIQIYFFYISKKLILKIEKKKGLTIFWIVALALWTFLSYYDIKMYITYKNSLQFLADICWIEVSLLNIITSIRFSEVRENGLFIHLGLYQWNKVKAYNWVSNNIIEFKVNTFFNIHRRFKVIVELNDEERSKLDKILKGLIK